MKERPIIFSAPMVRAILAGTKTQTRRIVRDYSPGAGGDSPTWRLLHDGRWYPIVEDGTPHSSVRGGGARCPYGAPGDRLWVRETWQAIRVSIDPETGYGDDVRAADKIPSDSQHGYWGVAYAATDPQANEHRDDRGFVWRPGIHMPRWASRITLEITDVRVERLQDISGMDAKREGVSVPAHLPHDGADLDYARREYRRLWQSINGPGSWDANPWVWVIEFKKLEQAGLYTEDDIDD